MNRKYKKSRHLIRVSFFILSQSQVLLLSLFGLGLTTLSCDDETGPSSKSCGHNTDCPLPESCIEGMCRLECRVSTDCAGDARCYEGVCYERPGICRSNEVCAPFQEVCDMQLGVCVPPDRVTPTGGVSAGAPAGDTSGTSGGENTGRPIDEGGAAAGDSGGSTGGQMGGATASGVMAGDESSGVSAGQASGEQSGASTAGDLMSGETGGDSPPIGQGQYGDDCNCPSDCASGYCVVNKMKRSRTCSAGCEIEADCPGIDTCLQAQVSPASMRCPDTPGQLPPPGTIVGVCAPNETSFPCADPAGCTSGICLSPPQVVPWTSPQSVCTMACETDRKCPVGYRCGAAGGVTGTICIPEAEVSACPTGMANTCGGVCPAAPGRDESELVVCLNGFNQTAGYCTCTCSVATDCPNGFACSRIGDTGDPSRPGVCIPISGAVCPESDQGVEQCLSTTCLVDEEDRSQNICTSFCQGAADCPAEYDCVPVGDSAVCVPRER